MPRPIAHPVEYTDIMYKEHAYTIGTVTHTEKGELKTVYFIIDSADKERVQEHHWCVVAKNYVGYYVMHDGKRKSICMHNFIMHRMEFLGKGQESSYDHINGVGFDNRRCNLRFASQSLQNRNTKERARRVTNLPDGISLDELPRNIWYMPANGSHGDRFVVELKGIPDVGNLEVKTTSSKHVDARTKLDEAIRIKNELLERYPILVEFSRMSERSEELKQDYQILVDYMDGK